MNNEDQNGMMNLLRQSMPPVDAAAEPARDLWPAMLRRLDQRAAPPWFDWALVAGLGVCAVASPAWLPVILYFL